jgi:hypothetical protein
VFTYVRWYWPDDDCWNYEELDADRWPVRHVEVRRSGSAVIAAASLVEALAARDSGDLDAVRHYEQRYGILPDGPSRPRAPLKIRPWKRLRPPTSSDYGEARASTSN